MEKLSGDLSDFALTDILQILALCQKTGVLSLEGADYAGKIVVEKGRITYAACTPGQPLSERLAEAQEHATTYETRSGSSPNGTTGAVMQMIDLEWIASQHFRGVVAQLVTREKGHFWIDVTHPSLIMPKDEIRLQEGLDIADVLLEAAQEHDEAHRDDAPSGNESNDDDDDEKFFENLYEVNSPSSQSVSEHLYSYLIELRSLSFETEVSLLLMRYASEIVNRGVLFGVNERELRGLGQFGFKARDCEVTLDSEVRNLKLSIQSNSVLSQVLQTSQPYIGPMPDDLWHKVMTSHLGTGSRGCWGFVVPLLCGPRAMFLLYGDDYPGGQAINGFSELIILANQSSMALEKIQLERMLRQAQLAR